MALAVTSKVDILTNNTTTVFFPLFSKFWSKLEASIRNDFDIISFKDKLKCTFKARRQKHFNYGEKLANSLLCRMRIGRSCLKSHGFAINLLSSDRCMCRAVDDNNHLLLFAELQIQILPLIENLEWLYIWGVVDCTPSSVGPSVGRSVGRKILGLEVAGSLGILGVW